MLFLWLVAVPAFADDRAAGTLDLELPQQRMFGGQTPYQSDAPGTYYGDTSGDPAPVARFEPSCPTAPDGSERSVTGSVTTGIGYSSRGGNSNFNAANLNFCKGFADDDGDVHTLNVNIDVQRYDGPGYIGRYGRDGAWDVPPPRR